MIHIILVFNVPRVVRNKQLFNLFSLYGNIERIVVGRDKNIAIITFEHENDQMTAFHYLNGQSLYDLPLILLPLKYPFILLQKCPLFPLFNFFEQFFLNSSKINSFNLQTDSLCSEMPSIMDQLQSILKNGGLAQIIEPRLKFDTSFDANDFIGPIMAFLIDYLHNLKFLREPLNLQQFAKIYSKMENVECLNLLKAKGYGDSKSFDILLLEESPLRPESVDYRKSRKKFKDGMHSKTKKINRPNKILYIFNLSDSLSLESIKDMFEGFEKVENYFYLNDSKNSALFHFRNVQAACHVLCTFKNVKLIEKNLKINFADEKLLQSSSFNFSAKNKFEAPLKSMFYNVNPQLLAPNNNYPGIMKPSAMNFFGVGNGPSDWQMNGQQNYWHLSQQGGSSPSPNPKFPGFRN